jgi:hypothetical protein
LPESIERLFPKLTNYAVTSAEDPSYNCIAFAAGDTARKWDPGRFPDPGYYWPSAALGEDNDSIDALKRLFATIGFEDCVDADPEAGYCKVALYALTKDDWLHASIQDVNGQWYSKLGVSYDIRHKTPQCLEGPTYGSVVCFMRKPVAAVPESP